MFPGIWVFETHNVGGGFPDLVVGWRREQTVVLVELKDKDARDRLTKNEERFHRDYPGDNLIVASGVREILDALGYPDF